MSERNEIKWETCSPRERSRAVWRGSDRPTFYAAVGLYDVWLSFDGECWRWVLEFAGECDMPEPMVDGAHGLFGMGSDHCAMKRAEEMALALSDMIDGKGSR